MEADVASILGVAGVGLILLGMALGVWWRAHGGSPRSLFIDLMLVGGAGLAGLVGLGRHALGDLEGMVVLWTQALLVGLFFGRLWGRREATGSASWTPPGPEA